MKEPEAVQLLDWRINRVSWTTAPFVPAGATDPIPEGAPVTETALLKINNITFGSYIPNVAALFLESSYNSYLKASDAFGKIKPRELTISQVPSEMTFSYFESIMSSVVFACTALEAFANEEIPNNYCYTIIEKNKTTSYNKEQIERNISLDTKIGDVLSLALNIKSPKGTAVWAEYIKLRELRDRIIHIKSKDRLFLNDGADSIWPALLNNKIPKTYIVAKNVMGYYFSRKSTKVRWFEKCPF